MSSERLGIAVIGAGYWGRKLIAEYWALSKKRNDVELRYVVDSDKDRLASIAGELSLESGMLATDSAEVIGDSSVQAVHVATPNETHFSIGMDALEQRKHVLLEKPMALNMREAVKLARKAEEESVVLHVGHIFRFNNAVTQTRELISKGAIGKPLYCNLHWEALIKPPKGRDIIFDLGPHPVDVLNYLFDEWPTRVRALGRSFLRNEHHREEVAEAVVEFEGDFFACIRMSWLYPGPKKRSISIAGDSGGIEVDALDQQVLIYRGGESKVHPVQVNNTIESMITHFLGSIRNREPPQNSALVGAMTVGVLSAMMESMRSGRFVKVLGTA